MIPERSTLKEAVAFPYIWSVGQQEGLTTGSTAGKDDVVDKQIKSGAQVIESESGLLCPITQTRPGSLAYISGK